MKLVSWNVNGIRACAQKTFHRWVTEENADIICLQETKASQDQLTPEICQIPGYESYWHSAEKKGYSGVAIYTRHAPEDVQHGIGIEKIDREGRVLLMEFSKFVLLNAYFPNSQRDHARLDYKLFFCEEILNFCNHLVQKGKNVIVTGDFNIAHQEIDLANPKSNQNNAGFLPQERDWMTKFIGNGYVDTFREFTKEGGHYTWWSYRPGVREKNIGWRLDYFFVNQRFRNAVKKAAIQPSVIGSDHCPVVLQLEL